MNSDFKLEKLHSTVVSSAVHLRRDGVTLNFDLLTQNVIRSSVSQDAPVTKVWRKFINRYWRYSGNVKIWDAFGDAVTLNFDLLTPKSDQFISVPRCISDKSLAKIRQQILEISRKHKTTT